MAIHKKQPMVLIGAKVPVELKDMIEKRAQKDRRTVSQIVMLLLSSHPELKPKRKANTV